MLDPHHLPAMSEGKILVPFQVPSLSKGSVMTSDVFKGKTTLLNVWASWCRSCEEEQTFLMQLEKEGFAIYGLNYKDTQKDALTWLKTWGNPYQEVGLDSSGAVAIDLGVYGTPETFLIDANGIVQLRYAGVLNHRVWTRLFLPCLKKLQKAASDNTSR